MSDAGSLVDLDQQIISDAKYRRQTNPNGGLEVAKNKHNMALTTENKLKII